MSENPALRPARPAPPFTSPPVELPPRDGVRCVKNVLVPMSDGVRLSMDLHVPGPRRLGRRAPARCSWSTCPTARTTSPPTRGRSSRWPSTATSGPGSTAGGRAAARGRPPTSTPSGSSRTGRRRWSGSPASPGAPARWGCSASPTAGFTALQVAALQPPHLATIVPVYFTDDRYTDDCHYRGGCLRGYYDVGAYGAWMVGLNAMPPYPEWSGDGLGPGVGGAPRAATSPTCSSGWRTRPTASTGATGACAGQRYDRIRCPVFLIGGWRDGYPNPPLRTFAQLRVPKKVLVGPWNHTWPDVAIPGPRIDWVRELRRWCDHWLKGEANGVADEPAGHLLHAALRRAPGRPPGHDRLLARGAGLPAPRRDRAGAVPRAGGGLATRLAAADRARCLDRRRADEAPSRRLRRTGRPSASPADCGAGASPSGCPTDQRPDEIDALTYTTAPLRSRWRSSAGPRPCCTSARRRR